jgi:hypothetical protein
MSILLKTGLKKRTPLKTVCVGVLLTISFIAHAQVKDYLAVPGPIQFDSVAYSLSWSSHPTPNYYKHEYLPKGDDPDKYKQMLLLEFVAGNWTARAVLDAKVRELDEAKKINPLVSYSIMRNGSAGEVILDFVLSKNSVDGKTILVVERNVYRYKKIKTSSGQDGVLLFGVSMRSYGDDIMNFVTDLKNSRRVLVNAVAKAPLSDISLNN